MTLILWIVLSFWGCWGICLEKIISQSGSILNSLNSLAPGSLVNNSTGVQLDSEHHGRSWPRERQCFPPSSRGSPLTVTKCRQTLKDIETHSGSLYRRPLNFWREVSPRIQGLTPPFRFQNPQDQCEIILDVGTDLPNARSVISFIEVKRKAQDILQDCEDEGLSQGGLAPIGNPRGWYIEIGRVARVNVVASYTDDALRYNNSVRASTALNLPSNTPHEIECFSADHRSFPVSIEDCRPVFRNMQRSTMNLSPPAFRLVQDFEARVRPRFPARPPIAFAGRSCIVGIKVGQDHYHVVGRFSFEQAKNVGYEILEHCKDRGGLGGRAPIGSPFGWFVHVLKDYQPPRLESNSTIQTLVQERSLEYSIADRSITKESNISETLLGGVVQCSNAFTNPRPILLNDCKPVIAHMKSLPNAHTTQVFSWGRQPYVSGYNRPPFTFSDFNSPCQILISTSEPWRVERFSLYFAAVVAEQIIQQCKRGKRKEFYGGTKQLRTTEGWFVSIRGQPEDQRTSLNALSSEAASTNISSLTYRVNCYDQQRNRKRITYEQCKPTINSIKTIMKDAFNARQTFQFGRKPDVRVRGYPVRYPPFLFNEKGTDCFVHLDTYHREDVDTFSWREVWQTAKDILTFCEEEQGEYYGGIRLVGSRQSWYVMINGPRNGQPGVLALSGNGSVDAM